MTLPAADHPVLEYANRARRAMLQRNMKLLNSLTREYARAYKSLRTEFLALQEALAVAQPTAGQIANLAAHRALMDGIRSEMNRFAAEMAGQVEVATLKEIEAAGVDSLGMVQASLPGLEPARLVGTWTRLAPNQVYNMHGFLHPDGPLYATMKGQFGNAVAKQLSSILLQNYIQGRNPREIARMMARVKAQGMGVGLDWALNTARTAALWGYRSASHLNYLNNSHVVRAWMWHAELGDDRTCMSCISQHGSIHPLHEILADHHRGRCTPIPVTATYAELGIEGVADIPLKVQRGDDWFKGLPEGRQKKLMGPAKFRAWQDGAFTFDQLSRIYNDKIYGRMIREATLREILGEKATLYYAHTNAGAQ